jgi:uncharacterized membrane protein (DUF2068 family)
MSVDKLAERPQKVVMAVRMLYLLIAIGIVRTSMTVIRHVDVRSPYFLISIKLMVYAVTLVLIYQVSRGRNWARWLLLAVVAIAFPLSILPIFETLAHNPVHTLLGYLQLALYIAAMSFLFQRSSSDWFRAGK